MLNNANGASVWTQLVQITVLTNWLDSSQQSWGVCQGQVLGAGRGARQSAGLGGARPPWGGAGACEGACHQAQWQHELELTTKEA